MRGAGAVLLSSRSETLAFVGEVLDEGAYDRLGDVTEAAAAGLE